MPTPKNTAAISSWTFLPSTVVMTISSGVKLSSEPQSGLKLYQPGDGDPRGEQNWMRSWTVTKGEAACHCAVPKDKVKTTYDEKKA